MSVNFPRATRRYIPEDMILHNNRCENLQSYTVFFLMRQTSVLSLLKYTFISRVEAQICNSLQSCSTDCRSMIQSPPQLPTCLQQRSHRLEEVEYIYLIQTSLMCVTLDPV
jgi:hypothetical protein